MDFVRTGRAITCLILLVSSSPLQAADSRLTLNPKRPLIDVTGEIDRNRARQRPATKVIRKRLRKTPEVRSSVQEVRPVERQTVERTIEGVLREDLPPLDGADNNNGAPTSNDSERSTRKRRYDRNVFRAPQQRRFKPLSIDAWRGVTMKRFEQMSRDYARRPRSRAIRALWVRMFASDARPPAGAYNDVSFEALRMQALYRLGAVQIIADHAATVPDDARYEVLNILEAKSRIALGDEETTCASVKSLISATGKVAEHLQRAFVEISVYCALRSDDRTRAALMIELSRDRGLDAPVTFEIVDALTLGRTPKLPKAGRLALVPGKLLVLGGYKPNRRFYTIATPALLLALAHDPDVDAAIRIASAERAAELGALSPQGLRATYLGSGRTEGMHGRRASIMREIDELSRARASGGRLLHAARRLLDASRTGTLYPVIAAMLGPDIKDLRQTRDTQALAETAVEIATAAGLHDAALGWAIYGSSFDTAGVGGTTRGLMHWQMPIDISDNRRGVPRGAGLKPTERLALRGQFSSGVLHRLVTALDSLGYVVPIPLWNKASASPQPAKGYLPKTGVLAELAQASKARQSGHTLLLAIAAFGPDGASGAHLISLGDGLRALRRAGLEDAARDIAAEMVFPVWPRQSRR